MRIYTRITEHEIRFLIKLLLVPISFLYGIIFFFGLLKISCPQNNVEIAQLKHYGAAQLNNNVGPFGIKFFVARNLFFVKLCKQYGFFGEYQGGVFINR